MKINKKRDKKSRLKIFLIIFFNILGVIICLYFILNLNLLKTVNVKGNHEVTDQDIIDASNLKVNQNILKIIFNKKDIQNKVKYKIPQIKEIEVNIKDFNNVTLSIKEYNIIGYIQSDNHYLAILENGRLDPNFRKKIYQDRPIFEGFNTKSQIKNISTIFEKINPSIRNTISEVKLTHSKVNPNQITLNMDDGNIVIGDLTTIVKKISNYSFLTKGKKKPLIVDLEVGTFVKQQK